MTAGLCRPMTAFILRLHSQLFAAPLVKGKWHLRMDWHTASVMWNGSWALLAVLVEIVHKLFMKTRMYLGISGKLLSFGWSVNLSYSLIWYCGEASGTYTFPWNSSTAFSKPYLLNLQAPCLCLLECLFFSRKSLHGLSTPVPLISVSILFKSSCSSPGC